MAVDTLCVTTNAVVIVPFWQKQNWHVTSKLGICSTQGRIQLKFSEEGQNDVNLLL